MTEGRSRKISMKDIEQHIIISEMLPGMIPPPPPLVNHLNFYGMADYGDNILLDLASEVPDLKPHTTTLQYLASTTLLIPENSQTIYLK